MANETPVISTVIPCYNQAHYLRSAVQSLQGQTFSQWEAIVVNDGSSDHTQSLAEELSQQDPRVRVIRHENRGLPAARNSGIRNARGKYLHLLDADDLLHPHAFEWLLAGIGDDQRTLAVMKFAFFKHDPKEDLWTEGSERKYEPFVVQLIKNNLGTCHAYLAPRPLVMKLGGFDESIQAGEEDLWLRMALHGCRLAVIPRIGAYYRRYNGSMSTDPITALKGWIQAQIRAYRWLKEGTGQLVMIDQQTRQDAISQVKQQVLFALGKTALQLICAGRFADGIQLWRITRQHFLTHGWGEHVKLARELSPQIPYMLIGRTTRLTRQQQRDASMLSDLVMYCLKEAPLIPDSFPHETS